ncbi:MAG: c-type cytochrome [Campylobacterales bacterium]|nr:c-type cytochrome [Campylobacterales bacterium]
MKKLNLILLSVGAALALSGCGEIGAEGQAITYEKTPADVYKTSCASCHGDKAQGDESKKAPALAQKQAGELELAIYNANNKAGDIKEHIRKGVFDAKAMAQYLEKEFFVLPPKEAPAPVEEPTPVEETPVPTETPTATEAPAPTETPATTEAPAPTEAPAASPAPEATPAPEANATN